MTRDDSRVPYSWSILKRPVAQKTGVTLGTSFLSSIPSPVRLVEVTTIIVATSRLVKPSVAIETLLVLYDSYLNEENRFISYWTIIIG